MKKVLIVLMMLVCIMVTGCGETATDEMISVSEVKKIVDNYSNYPGVYIVDVREEYEYEAGHIEEAVNVPLDEIEEIIYNKDARIIVYCQSGKRSSEAAIKLKDLGYTDVSDMGGISNWPYALVK